MPVPSVVWDDERDATPDVVWDAPDVSGLESAGRGAVQGATFSFADEGYGLAKALGGTLTGADGSFADRYRGARDESRALDQAAEEANPKSYRAGEFGGALATAFVPGLGEIGAAKGLGGALAGGAALGAAQGLGSSEADLTRGDVGGAAVDTGLGALIGAGAGAVGHGAGKVLERLSGRAAEGVAGATARIETEEAAKAAQATATARSEAGNAAQAAYRKLEHLRELNGKGLLTDEGRQLAASLEDELAQKAAAELPEAAARKASAGEAYRQAIESEADRAAAGAAGRTVMGQVMPRLKRYGLPLAGQLVGGYIGSEIGGTPGALVGATIGGAAAGFKRPMQHALKRMFQSPEVRRAAWQAVQGSVSLLGKFGQGLQRAATRGGIGLARTLHESLLDSDPEYQSQVMNLLENPEGGQ